MYTTPQEDLLIAVALVRFGHENPEFKVSDHAWRLADRLVAEHGLTLGDAVRQADL